MKNNLEKMCLGALLGLSLAWVMVSVHKTLLDGGAWGSFREGWVALILLLGVLALSYPRLASSASNPQTKLKKRLAYGLFVLGLLSGGGMVLSWQSQMSGEQLLSDMEHQKHKAMSTATLVEALVSSNDALSCPKAQSFFISLKENRNWRLLMEEKFWFKDLALRLHAQKCLTDREVFEVVALLRDVPAQNIPLRSARFGMNFGQDQIQKNREEYVRAFLGINALEWCLQKNPDPSACSHEDSRAILSGPPVQF